MPDTNSCYNVSRILSLIKGTRMSILFEHKRCFRFIHRVVHARKLTVNSCTQEFSFTVTFLICFHVGMVIDCILDCIKLWKHVPLVFYHLCRAVSEMAEILLVWKCGVPCLYKCIELIFTGQTALLSQSRSVVFRIDFNVV